MTERPETVAEAIRHFLIVRSASCDGALDKACADIAWLHARLEALEADLAAARAGQSAGYHRRPPPTD